MKRITTESGAVYLLESENGMIMRIGSDVKRGDGQWLVLHNEPEVEIGFVMVLIVDSLARLGPDDDGRESSDSPVTTRITTEVVSIEDVRAVG